MPMRVLLQNTETKLYFIDANEWTADPLKATDFEDVELAAEVYHSHDLAYARIVLAPMRLPGRPAPAAVELAGQARSAG